ncbi:hypothetical protein LCGC14_2225570 [marine sediment metagenome]|uniref:Uncharacterized protein n=1 Tax=marine sediment metagenome TaxID=412755 RepID=A0A0F9D9S4_9ZZZZ
MVDKAKVIKTWEHILKVEKIGKGLRLLIEETLKCLRRDNDQA